MSILVVEQELLTPRERYVRRVFDAIAGHYDGFNMLATLGIMRSWYRAVARATGLVAGDSAVDVCAGTGQLTALLARQVAPAGTVAAVDFSPVMLERAARRLLRARVDGRVELVEANALNMPFPSGSFAACTMGFALRNIPDIPGVMREMARVTRVGGRVVVLELSRPPAAIVRAPYYFYLFRVMPLLGRLVEWLSGSQRLRPYAYLPHSLIPLPGPAELADMMRDAGLERVSYRYLTGGIACLHVGERRPDHEHNR